MTTDWELYEKLVCRCGAPNYYGQLKGLKYISPCEQQQLLPSLPHFLKRRIGAG